MPSWLATVTSTSVLNSGSWHSSRFSFHQMSSGGLNSMYVLWSKRNLTTGEFPQRLKLLPKMRTIRSLLAAKLPLDGTELGLKAVTVGTERYEKYELCCGHLFSS